MAGVKRLKVEEVDSVVYVLVNKELISLGLESRVKFLSLN